MQHHNNSPFFFNLASPYNFNGYFQNVVLAYFLVQKRRKKLKTLKT